MKKLSIIIAVLSVFNNNLFAQKTAGKITYEIRTNWLKVLAKATYLTQEQKDRETQTWKNHERKPYKTILDFNEKGSFYTYETQSGESSEGNYTWAFDDKYIIRDLTQNKTIEMIELLGKPYIIEDSLRADNWKILNEIKDISGYVCMKATTVDTIRNHKIEAWFTTDIPVSIGPERFCGLPGMILEANVDDGFLVITPFKIEMADTHELPVLPKHKKHKIIDTAKYNEMVSDYIKQQAAMHELPWSIFD